MSRKISNTEQFNTLSQQDTFLINGGGIVSIAIQFIKDYIGAKTLDWVLDHREEIWEDFKDGPAANDPMKQTDFYQIFGNTAY